MAKDPPLLGRVLGGRFRVTAFIGEGAMASVYRGVQDAEPTDVAVKILNPDLKNDRTFVRRFEREAKAASRIQHPHTTRILAYGEDQGVFYIAMELLAGRDLFELLVVERRLQPLRAVRIMMQVAEALHAAHEQGIVHRDLKPENVMLVADPAAPEREFVKVLDFGIAKVMERERPAEGADSDTAVSVLTRVGIVVGTPEYMSPEQCKGEAIDARSDVYACGVVLYHLLTGKPPFVGETSYAIALKHLRETAPPPSRSAPGIPPRLDEVVAHALAKWPAERPASAAAFRDELAAVARELETGIPLDSAPPSSLDSIGEPTQTWVRPELQDVSVAPQHTVPFMTVPFPPNQPGPSPTFADNVAGGRLAPSAPPSDPSVPRTSPSQVAIAPPRPAELASVSSTVRSADVGTAGAPERAQPHASEMPPTPAPMPAPAPAPPPARAGGPSWGLVVGAFVVGMLIGLAVFAIVILGRR